MMDIRLLTEVPNSSGTAMDEKYGSLQIFH